MNKSVKSPCLLVLSSGNRFVRLCALYQIPVVTDKVKRYMSKLPGREIGENTIHFSHAWEWATGERVETQFLLIMQPEEIIVPVCILIYAGKFVTVF